MKDSYLTQVIHKAQSLVCVDGTLPKNLKKFLKKNPGLRVVAADGAYYKLKKQGIIPAYIVGDMDSVARNHIPENVTILQDFIDQNTTDLEKIMALNEIMPSIVTGIAGGELDHILFNVHVLLQNPGTLWWAPPLCGLCLGEGTHTMWWNSSADDCSILGEKGVIVSSQGLFWNMENHVFGNKYMGHSLSNKRLPKESITLDVHHGHVIVCVYGNPDTLWHARISV